MRMWMVPVQYMCRKHLLGEHVDLSGLPAEHALATVDVESSLLDLIHRCPDCKARYYEQVEAGHGLAA